MISLSSFVTHAPRAHASHRASRHGATSITQVLEAPVSLSTGKTSYTVIPPLPGPPDPYYGKKDLAMVCSGYIQSLYRCNDGHDVPNTDSTVQNNKKTSLSVFIAWSIFKTRTEQTVLFCALYLLRRLKVYLEVNYPEVMVRDGIRIFIPALSLAHKIVYDKSYGCKVWAKVSKGWFSAEDIMEMEREMLSFIDFNVDIDGGALDRLATAVRKQDFRGAEDERRTERLTHYKASEERSNSLSLYLVVPSGSTGKNRIWLIPSPRSSATISLSHEDPLIPPWPHSCSMQTGGSSHVAQAAFASVSQPESSFVTSRPSASSSAVPHSLEHPTRYTSNVCYASASQDRAPPDLFRYSQDIELLEAQPSVVGVSRSLSRTSAASYIAAAIPLSYRSNTYSQGIGGGSSSSHAPSSAYLDRAQGMASATQSTRSFTAQVATAYPRAGDSARGIFFNEYVDLSPGSPSAPVIPPRYPVTAYHPGVGRPLADGHMHQPATSFPNRSAVPVTSLPRGTFFAVPRVELGPLRVPPRPQAPRPEQSSSQTGFTRAHGHITPYHRAVGCVW